MTSFGASNASVSRQTPNAEFKWKMTAVDLGLGDMAKKIITIILITTTKWPKPYFGKLYWKCNLFFYFDSSPIRLHGEGGVYDLYCSQPPGGDQRARSFTFQDMWGRGLHGGPETRGWVPIYYFGSRVFLTLCVIPESIGEHGTRQWSASVRLSMRVFCNLQFVKLGWEKCEREIRWKRIKTRVTSAARSRARAELMLVLQTDGAHGFLHEWCGKKSWNKTEETHLLLNTHAVECNELLILCVFC